MVSVKKNVCITIVIINFTEPDAYSPAYSFLVHLKANQIIIWLAFFFTKYKMVILLVVMKKNNIVNILKGGGAGVLPTDTLYGLVGSATSKKTVSRIYRLKKRMPKKPCIILISNIKELSEFSIILNTSDKEILKKFWPGKVSVVLPCPEKKFFYLHRGTKTLAFRLPQDKKLLAILKKVGPLLAPSANPEGFPPAKNINQAKKYFGEKVDFYSDGGKLKSRPSTLVSLKNGKVEVLREGAVSISTFLFPKEKWRKPACQ